MPPHDSHTQTHIHTHTLTLQTQNRDVREKLYRAFIKRASEGDFDNAENVKKVSVMCVHVCVHVCVCMCMCVCM